MEKAAEALQALELGVDGAQVTGEAAGASKEAKEDAAGVS